jgi:protein-tyrosine phosphatase
MIDLHSHILPAIDDGASTMDVSLDMAKRSLDEGIRTIVATPHVDLRYPNRLEEIDERVDSLRGALARAGVELVVLPGAEVAIPRLEELSDEQLVALGIARGPYLLLESPLRRGAGPVTPAVRYLRSRGLRTVLAHPERSPDFQQNPEELQRLVADGALCVINTGSLGRRFGSPSHRLAVWLLERGLVHCIASDAHDADHRPPALTKGLDQVERELPGIAKHADWYTETAPRAIIAGEGLPEAPPVPQRRANRSWWRLRR